VTYKSKYTFFDMRFHWYLHRCASKL